MQADTIDEAIDSIKDLNLSEKEYDKVLKQTSSGIAKKYNLDEKVL